MAPASAKANYKTYEAQARMVRAIVAAHPDVKWNYKDIAACYGSDMSKDALNHRFRRLKAQSRIIRLGRDQGLDMKNLDLEKDLPTTQDAVDEKHIAKYFGQSTTDGIQFQFRGIKKDADHLRQVEKKGGDVANCLSIGHSTGPMTPSKPTPTKLALSRPSASRSGTGAKRTRPITIKTNSSDEGDDDSDQDGWGSDQDDTPSKPKRAKNGALPGQKNGTPSRHAAVKASVTIADASARLHSSESADEADTPGSSGPVPSALSQQRAPAAAVPSIFGEVDQKLPSHGLALGDDFHIPFNGSGNDPFLGSDQISFGLGDNYDEFEI